MKMSSFRATSGLIFALAMLTLAAPSSAQQKMAPSAPAVVQAPAASQSPAAPSAPAAAPAAASPASDATAAPAEREGNILSSLLAAAMREARLSAGISSDAGIKERAASSFAEIVRAEARRIRLGMGLLASIGATSPFVGLFGTVWGIMNSFIGISKAQTTNLAVVAPGIAEALLATAIGLVAAIPAVIIYNHFARVTKGPEDGKMKGIAFITA